MGRLHALNAERCIDSAMVAAVADTDKQRADALAATLSGARVYQEPLDLIADPAVSAVVIATPMQTHAELVVACAKAGKDVFCEKPLATTMEAVVWAAQAVRERQVHLQVGFHRRYDPAYVLAKRTIESDVIGKPLLYKGITRDRKVPPIGSLTWAARSRMLVETGVHEFDLARWLMDDEAIRVQATVGVIANLAIADLQGPTTAVVNLQFANGAIANIEAFWGVLYGDDVRAEVIGSKGSLLIGTTARLPVQVMTEAGLVHQGYPDHFDRFRDAYLMELTAFVAAVSDGSSVMTPDATDGVRALEIALAAKASIESDMAPIDLKH